MSLQHFFTSEETLKPRKKYVVENSTLKDKYSSSFIVRFLKQTG